MNFFLFHIEIEGKCGWIIRGGGGKEYVGPRSQIIGGPAPPGPPLPTPMEKSVKFISPEDPQQSIRLNLYR